MDDLLNFSKIVAFKLSWLVRITGLESRRPPSLSEIEFIE